MKTSLRRRLDTVEKTMPRPVTEGVRIDLSLLSDEQLDILAGLAERRQAWPGDEASWLRDDLSGEEKQQLFEIATAVDAAGHAR